MTSSFVYFLPLNFPLSLGMADRELILHLGGGWVAMKDGCPLHGSSTACITIGSYFFLRDLCPRNGYKAAYCHSEKQNSDSLPAFEAIS